MSGAEDRHTRLLAAANPRRASAPDAGELADFFTSAFMTDPVFDWIARPGEQRAAGLRRFFLWLLRVRAIPFGEVWMAGGGSAAAVWLPPGVPASPGGVIAQLRLVPMFVSLCGFPRLLRGSAMADAMEKNHPHDAHFYLAFIAVAPSLRGMGLGSAIMEATLQRVDARGAAAYLENSNPKNTPLYERHGFVRQKNIAPRDAPPLIAMWRPAQPGQIANQGSSSLSQ